MCAKAWACHKCELAYSFAGCVGMRKISLRQCWRHAAGQHVGLWCNGPFAVFLAQLGATVSDRWKRLAYRTGWLWSWLLSNCSWSKNSTHKVNRNETQGIIRQFRAVDLKLIAMNTSKLSTSNSNHRPSAGVFYFDWINPKPSGPRSLWSSRKLRSHRPRVFAPFDWIQPEAIGPDRCRLFGNIEAIGGGFAPLIESTRPSDPIVVDSLATSSHRLVVACWLNQVRNHPTKPIENEAPVKADSEANSKHDRFHLTRSHRIRL
jgi:hypothetical protein